MQTMCWCRQLQRPQGCVGLGWVRDVSGHVGASAIHAVGVRIWCGLAVMYGMASQVGAAISLGRAP